MFINVKIYIILFIIVSYLTYYIILLLNKIILSLKLYNYI